MIQSILLIDDSEVDMQVSTSIIEHTGKIKNVVTKNSVISAVAYLQDCILGKHTFPEIILLDLNMPMLSGEDFLDIFELFDPIFKNQSQLVFVTSEVEQERINTVKENKYVSGIISKPISFLQLDTIIEKAQLLKSSNNAKNNGGFSLN